MVGILVSLGDGLFCFLFGGREWVEVGLICSNFGNMVNGLQELGFAWVGLCWLYIYIMLNFMALFFLFINFKTSPGIKVLSLFTFIFF